MRGIIISLVLIMVGVKYGIDYLRSFEFQAYAVKTKAPWICQMDNLIAELQVVGSDYGKAKFHFQRAMDRCPEDKDIVENAEYGIAKALEGMGQMRAAAWAYKNYADKYPGTKRAKVAQRASEVIGLS